MRITHANGKLWRGSQPFIAVGFNYHPSHTGCQYWQRWNPIQLVHDFRAMARRGFTVVRFFVFWSDFEPQPGIYDPLMLERLQAFVRLAGSNGLYCIPSLLTIWMNGQLFDLPWRQGRDLWTDTVMVERECQYVATLAAALADEAHVLAYDLGDEIIHVDMSSAGSLSRKQVITWQTQLAGAIRVAHPDALVMQGQELSSVLGGHAFRSENSQALDLIALHGYPTWTPLAIESIASYKASMLAPFLVQMARLDGTVLIDELGSYGADEEIGGAYLQSTTYSILANGAQGIIAWCWQDFTTHDPPYDAHPGERTAGFLDADGNPKKGMHVFQQFAGRVAHAWSSLQVPSASIGIYVSPYEDSAHTSYLREEQGAHGAAFSAFLLLKRAHLPCEFTRGPLISYKLVVCPSCEQLSWREQRLLEAYVEQGGMLYYSPGSYLHGFGGEDLFGVQLSDFTLRVEEMTGFSWRGQTYPVSWVSGGRASGQIPLIRATTATVLATFPNGTPAFTRLKRGNGYAYYLNAPLERFLDQPYLLEAQPWHNFYAHLADFASVEQGVDCSCPEVEVSVLLDRTRRYCFVINHSCQRVSALVTRRKAEQTGQQEVRQMELAGKEVRVFSWLADGNENMEEQSDS